MTSTNSTRFENEIAQAIKNHKNTDYLNMVLKVKTLDGFIYTIEECRYPKKTMSEEQYFQSLYNCARTHMDEISKAISTDKFIISLCEGRIISADNIKEIWIEFNIGGNTRMHLDDTHSMVSINQIREQWQEINSNDGTNVL